VSEDLVAPSEIPWDELKGREFEEFLYWLLDAMGAKDLTWRLGGEGQGASDGGRDVEAVFHVPYPDDTMVGEKWWIEAKGRGQTVEPAAVREAVLGAQAANDLDVLVIATNTQFSNPTRDWIDEWQIGHPRPRVKLWDRESLERMAVRHPSATARLFQSALTPKGRLELLRSRFWNGVHLAGRLELETVWKEIGHDRLSDEQLIALTVSEVANGDPAERPWPVAATADALEKGLLNSVVNGGYLLGRAERSGTSPRALLNGLSYFFLTACLRLPASDVQTILDRCGDFVEHPAPPREALRAFATTLVARAFGLLEEYCLADCNRVSFTDRPLPGKADARSFWTRFTAPDRRASEESRIQATLKSDEYFCIIHRDFECRAGVAKSGTGDCPFLDFSREDALKPETTALLKRLLQTRVDFRENIGMEFRDPDE